LDWVGGLKGGPFLEVSFLMELTKNIDETITELIHNLPLIPRSIEIVDDNKEELGFC
jgi:hypothetical protein